LEETLSHLTFALEMNYISAEFYKELETEGEEIDKMLNGYIGFLKKSKQGANEPGANLIIHEETVVYSTEPLEDSNDTEGTTL
jgi:23S rRNA-intervening sequence protein